jgi:hypothetical protein
MNEKNILALKTRLMQLGFEPSVETLIRCNICFQPLIFELIHTRQEGKDRFQFIVHIERGEKDLYELRFYTATLCKQIVIPAELELLDNSMQSVDWKLLITGKTVPAQIDHLSVQTAFDVLGKLQVVGVASDVLKYKYWVGTALEYLIQQLATLKNEWEISERFYFFDETAVISFEDAVRFLSSRWMEKQMAAKKKLLVKKVVSDKSGGGVSGGKLLGKNPRRLTRRPADKNT